MSWWFRQRVVHEPLSVLVSKSLVILTRLKDLKNALLPEFLSSWLRSSPKLPPGLPPMADFQVHTRRVTQVLACNPGRFTLNGTNTYVVGTGRHRMLIDCGEGRPAYATAIREACRRLDCDITTLLLTHSHFDHIGGLPQLRRLFPRIKVRRFDSSSDGLQDGETIVVDEETTLRVLFTPGHCFDHCCFLLPEEKAIFAGDNVLGYGTSWFENLDQYVASLRTMKNVAEREQLQRLYPGHGAASDDAQKLITYYLSHRLERETQITNHLKENTLTSLQLVRRIYGPTLPSFLIFAAQSNVLAHLNRLQRAGDVANISIDIWALLEEEKNK